MRMIQRLSNTIQPNSLQYVTCILAVFGTLIVLSGGIWDASSHALKEPEFFWTIQHMTVYSGVSMISGAAVISAAMILKNYSRNIGAKIILLSSVILIVSGFGESLSHDLYGIDGLISWSHQPLEFGLLLASIGGFFIIKSPTLTKIRFLEPISIITVLLSASWLGFNLLLLVGGVIQCIPVYEIFSSGCAIL